MTNVQFDHTFCIKHRGDTLCVHAGLACCRSAGGDKVVLTDRTTVSALIRATYASPPVQAKKHQITSNKRARHSFYAFPARQNSPGMNTFIFSLRRVTCLRSTHTAWIVLFLLAVNIRCSSTIFEGCTNFARPFLCYHPYRLGSFEIFPCPFLFNLFRCSSIP